MFFILYTNLADLNAFAHFRIVRKLFSKIDSCFCDVASCLSSKALYPWTTKQVSLRFTCSIFWELFRNSRTKCPHIQQLLNNKTIKHLRPWFFCVSTFPEIEEYKITVPWTFNKEIKKLRFLPSKMGGLIHGIDLYTGKYGKLHCSTPDYIYGSTCIIIIMKKLLLFRLCHFFHFFSLSTHNYVQRT